MRLIIKQVKQTASKVIIIISNNRWNASFDALRDTRVGNDNRSRFSIIRRNYANEGLIPQFSRWQTGLLLDPVILAKKGMLQNWCPIARWEKVVSDCS